MKTRRYTPWIRSSSARNVSNLAITMSLVFLLAIFAIDVVTPLTIVDGILYVCPIILTLWANQSAVVWLGIVTTLLTLLGYVLSPESSSDVFAFPNRGLSIVLIWSAVVLLRTSQKAMVHARLYRNRLQIFFDNVDQGILLVNRKGSILMVNPTTVEFTGYPAEELRKRNLDDILTIRSVSRNNTALFLPDLDNRESYAGKEFTCKLLRRNGDDYDVSMHVGHLSEESDLFAVFLKNISETVRQKKELQKAHTCLALYAKQLENLNESLEERVKQKTNDLSRAVTQLEILNIKYRESLTNAESSLDALREREQLLNTIADNFPNGLLGIIGKDSRYLLARGNDPGLNGNEPSVLQGSPFLGLRYCEQREYVSSMLSHGFEGEKITFEYHDPGSGHDYLVNGTPIGGSSSEVERLLLVSQNITALKRAEDDIRNALTKERELNLTKSNFVTTVSHEFRTPLTAILSSSSLIGMYNGPGETAKREKHVKRIAASVAYLTHILNEFLSLSQIESGKLCVSRGKVDLGELLADVLDELSLVRATGQKIIVTPMPCPLTLNTDRYMLRAILMNLMSNALKYSTAGTDVELEAQCTDTLLRLRVSDKGIGIPAHDQAHLFESFFRASNVNNIEGTGVGLHIVKKYVEILGGTITFRSAPGKGTTFEVELNNTVLANQAAAKNHSSHYFEFSGPNR